MSDNTGVGERVFREFDDYLSSEFGPDYWSDEGISHAAHLLIAFSDRDWQALASEWRARSTGWKVRCAEAIDSHSSPVVRSILIEMLESPEQEVVVAAADSLRFDPGRIDGIAELARHRIADIRDTAGPATKAVLSDFFKRITGQE